MATLFTSLKTSLKARLAGAGLLALLAAVTSLGQTPGVGIGTSAPNASAALDVASASKGALLPRLTAAARAAIAAPAAGLLLYQTDGASGFYYNAGTAAAPKWLRLTDADGVRYDPATGLQVGPGAVGAGTAATSATVGTSVSSGSDSPYNGSIGDQRVQYLLRAGQLAAAGVVAGQPLTALGFTVSSKVSTGPFVGFTIKLANTAATVASTTFPTTGLTTVYSQTYATVPGLNLHPFSTPFAWDGTSNLYLEFCFDNAANVGADLVETTGLSGYTSTGARYNLAVGCTGTGGIGTTSNTLPVFVLRQAALAGGAYALPALAGVPGQVLTQQAGGGVAFQALPVAGAALGSGSVVFGNGTGLAQDNANLFYNNGSKRLGIGTASPAFPLHVAGGAYSSGNVAEFTFENRANAAKRFSWFADANGANLWHNTTGTRLTVSEGGSLGIGTASPAFPLHVTGGAYSSGNGAEFTFDNRADAAKRFSWFADANGANLWHNTTGTRLTVTEGGNVGIGTAAPSGAAALDVSSTTRGLLPPRLSQAQRDAVTSTGAAGGPALGAGQAGLTVYNTTTNRLNVWDGTAWTEALATNQPTVLAPAATAFAYTGGPQYYTVPAGITRLRVLAQGAGGNDDVINNGNGSNGGTVAADLAVTPGQVLTLLVGGRVSGYNGGGAAYGYGAIYYNGGGATDVRTGSSLASRLLVAGGGGGASAAAGGGGTYVGLAGSPTVPPGSGQGGAGYFSVSNGGYYGGDNQGNDQAGGGGLASGGDGAWNSNTFNTRDGEPGTLGQGGHGGYDSGLLSSGGGGGGGYYGGGGGSSYGGGGGSSWVIGAGSSNVRYGTAGSGTDGNLTLTPLPTLPAPALDATNLTNQAGTNLPAGTVLFSDGQKPVADNKFYYDASTRSLSIGSAYPYSRLDVYGSLALPTRQTTTASTYLGFDDYLVRINRVSGAQNVFLPSPYSCPGRIYQVWNISTGTVNLYTFDVDTSGSFNQSSVKNFQYSNITQQPNNTIYTYHSDGTVWVITKQ